MQGPIFKLYDKDFISKSYLTWSILLDCILYFKFIMCFGNKATLLEAQNFYAYNVMPIETMRSHDIGAEWGTAPSSTAQETRYSWLKSRWSTWSCWEALVSISGCMQYPFLKYREKSWSSPGNRGAARAIVKEIKPLSAPQETRIWNDQLGICRMEAKTALNLVQINVL